MKSIEIQNVSRKFKVYGKGFYALQNVSLEINRGEIFALVGPNGSGKTTLLNIILGLLTPTSGSVRIFDRDAQSKGSLNVINFASGEERFNGCLTVRDILDFFARVYNLSQKERSSRINELVDFFGLEKITARRFDGLSTGEKMRLAFAKALLNRPQILLLDEPTLGLDPDIARKIRTQIKELKRGEETTILLTSHYMTEIEQLADRVALIKDGSILQVGTIESITQGASLEDYFVQELGRH